MLDQRAIEVGVTARGESFCDVGELELGELAELGTRHGLRGCEAQLHLRITLEGRTQALVLEVGGVVAGEIEGQVQGGKEVGLVEFGPDHVGRNPEERERLHLLVGRFHSYPRLHPDPRVDLDIHHSVRSGERLLGRVRVGGAGGLDQDDPVGVQVVGGEDLLRREGEIDRVAVDVVEAAGAEAKASTVEGTVAKGVGRPELDLLLRLNASDVEGIGVRHVEGVEGDHEVDRVVGDVFVEEVEVAASRSAEVLQGEDPVLHQVAHLAVVRLVSLGHREVGAPLEEPVADQQVLAEDLVVVDHSLDPAELGDQDGLERIPAPEADLLADPVVRGAGNELADADLPAGPSS